MTKKQTKKKDRVVEVVEEKPILKNVELRKDVDCQVVYANCAFLSHSAVDVRIIFSIISTDEDANKNLLADPMVTVYMTRKVAQKVCHLLQDQLRVGTWSAD